MLVVEQWPHRRDACLAQAAAAAAATPHTSSSRGRAAGGVAGAESASAHAAATLAWLADHNNMETRIVEQVVGLKPRVIASTGSGVFAGGLTGAMLSCAVLRCVTPCYGL